jgi:hypothetical protein
VLRKEACGRGPCYPALPNNSGNPATFIAIRPASSGPRVATRVKGRVSLGESYAADGLGDPSASVRL